MPSIEFDPARRAPRRCSPRRWLQADVNPRTTATIKSKLPIKPGKRSRKVHRRCEDFDYYEVKLGGWDYHCSFGISDPRNRSASAPYRSLSILTFTGELTYPEKCRHMIGKLSLTARSGATSLPDYPLPNEVGSFTSRGGTLEASVTVPKDQLVEMIAVAVSGRIQVVGICGSKPRHGYGSVRWITIDTKPEEKDSQHDGSHG